MLFDGTLDHRVGRQVASSQRHAYWREHVSLEECRGHYLPPERSATLLAAAAGMYRALAATPHPVRVEALLSSGGILRP